MHIDACEVLVTLARVRHFGRAAELLHVSPSTVSVRLKALEDSLGVRLVDREPEVRLTPAGEALLPHCEAILRHAREIELTSARFTGQVRGEVRIGASQTVGTYVLPPLLARFRHSYPAARLVLQIGNSHDILTAVDHGYLDFGLVETPTVHRLTRTLWVEDELSLVLSPRHPLATKHPILPEDILPFLLIVREEGSGTRQTLESALPKDIWQHLTTAEVGSTEAIKRWVEEGEALAFLSPLAVQQELAAGHLTLRPVVGVEARRWFTLVRRPETFASTAAEKAYHHLLRQKERVLAVLHHPEAL